MNEPEWLSLNLATGRWLEAVRQTHVGRDWPADMIDMPEGIARLYQSEFNQAIRASKFQPRGVKVTDSGSPRNGAPMTIERFYFRLDRTFRPQHNLIEPQSDTQSVQDWMIASDGGERSPTWHDVYMPARAFLAWLEMWTRGHLTNDVANGRIEPDAAESALASLNFAPLLKEPDVSAFRPQDEAFWTLPMAAAWIAWRDFRAVARQWQEYRKHGGWWSESRGPNQIKPGFIIEERPPATLVGLLAYEAAYQAMDNIPALMSVEPAIRELWNQLQHGALEATGTPENGGSRQAIPAHQWQDFDYYETRGHDVVRRRPGVVLDGYLAVTLPREKVMAIWQDNSAAMLPIAIDGGTPSRRLVSKSELESAYQDRVKSWEAGDPTPGEKEDLIAMKRVEPNITRERVRQLRRDFAPDTWKAKGVGKGKKSATRNARKS